MKRLAIVLLVLAGCTTPTFPIGEEPPAAPPTCNTEPGEWNPCTTFPPQPLDTTPYCQPWTDNFGYTFPCHAPAEPCTSGSTLWFVQACRPYLNPPIAEWCIEWPDHPACAGLVPEVTS